jgi:hypothetical protein
MPPDTVQWPSPEEIRRWAHRRRPHEREAVPQPGERLLFREREFGEAAPAVVADVQDMDTPGDHWTPPGGLPGHQGPPDLNVWEPELDGRGQPSGRYRLKEDPWPWVAVQPVITAQDGTETLGVPRWTKESRVRGSAGWLRAGTRAHTGRYESGA